MTIEKLVDLPALKEQFTVSANCQACADRIGAEILDLSHEISGSMLRHTLRQIDVSQAVIRDSDGTQINGARNFDYV